MHTEDLASDNSSNGQGVERINEKLPCLDVATTFALVVETINTSHIGALMVSSEEEEVLWVFDLIAEKEKDRLQRLFTSVHVVTQE